VKDLLALLRNEMDESLATLERALLHKSLRNADGFRVRRTFVRSTDVLIGRAATRRLRKLRPAMRAAL